MVTGTGFCFSKTGQNFNQLRLSVSIDTGQTYNLAFAHIQVEALSGSQPHGNPLACRSLHMQNHLARPP